jgi:hypothetical protein
MMMRTKAPGGKDDKVDVEDDDNLSVSSSSQEGQGQGQNDDDQQQHEEEEEEDKYEDDDDMPPPPPIARTQSKRWERLYVNQNRNEALSRAQRMNKFRGHSSILNQVRLAVMSLLHQVDSTYGNWITLESFEEFVMLNSSSLRDLRV